MSCYKIYPLHLGTITRPKAQLMATDKSGAVLEIPILAWYLTDGEKRILVDTGGLEPDGIHFMPYVRPESQRLEAALGRLGVLGADIDMVILTHLHWDHSGCLGIFPNAEFFVQRAELHYAIDPIPAHKNNYDLQRIFSVDYTILDGDTQITDGVSVIFSPGHSNGHQCVLVDTVDGPYMILGDMVNLMEAWTAVPPVANGYHVSLLDYHRSFQKLKHISAKVLPGHDPEVLKHPVYPAEENGELGIEDKKGAVQ